VVSNRWETTFRQTSAVKEKRRKTQGKFNLTKKKKNKKEKEKGETNRKFENVITTASVKLTETDAISASLVACATKATSPSVVAVAIVISATTAWSVIWERKRKGLKNNQCTQGKT